MAEIKDVRLEESLRVRIGEAKDLPTPSSISGSGRSTCCAIRIDSEEIFRTATVDKSLNPLYSAEFSGEIPRKFRHLSFYVFDVGGKKHKVIGKVLLKKEELYKYNQKEHWFPLQGQDGVAEVEGKVHLEVRLEECLTPDSFASKHMMAVRVVECNDLKVINGSCNPYAVVTLSPGKASKNKECKRTAVRKKTICPHFDETFFFSLDGKTNNHSGSVYSVDDVCAGELSISLFHDDSKVSREVLGNKFKGHFLGEVKISLSHIDFTFPHKAWYCLQAKESHKNNGLRELGSLRLCINYTADYVFPATYYEELRNLILKSVDSSIPITSTVVFLLGEIADNRQIASQALVRLFLNHGKLVPLIHALSDWEMSSCIDPNTLFRGNSLLTKIVDELMKLVGIPYLHDTLKTIIHQICSDPKPCEIDPGRLKEGEDLAINQENLHSLVSEVLSSIVGSGLVCPLVMRDIFSTLKSRAIRNYPENSSVRYHAVTSFVFLRFFSAAILGPKLFDLYTDAMDGTVQRTLTLISKAIAGLVNLVSSKGASVTVKEEYMVPLYNNFPASTQMEIKMFLDIISSSSGIHFKSIEAPIILKEGTMIKRAQGRKKFGRKNFKRRHFVLTNQSLSYYTKAGGKVLFEMPINDILAVEKLEEESFKMKYMFQVVQAERALYIQASHCVEEKEWIDILTKICKSNANRRKMYHPAAFVNGHWLCCKSTDHSLVGCKLVSGYFPPSELQLDIDSDREVEKIHSLFLDKMDKLDDIKAELEIEMDGIFYEDEATAVVEEMVVVEEVEGTNGEMCGTQAVYAGGCDGGDSSLRNMGSGLKAMCSDPASCFVTISEIQKAIITLEHEHIQYMRSVHKNAVIGSLDTPIGDGSSADLLRNLNRSSERLSRHGSRSSNASNMSRRSNRMCHSRGNSFRDRSRSGTDGDRVKKSLSGDVSVSTRSLAVEFKLDKRKAASYDTFASVERRRSHGTVEFSRVGRFAVDSSGHLLSYGMTGGDHMSMTDGGRWYGGNNVSRDSVLECDGDGPTEMEEDDGGGGTENHTMVGSVSGGNIGHVNGGRGSGGRNSSRPLSTTSDATAVSVSLPGGNHSRVAAHASWPCSGNQQLQQQGYSQTPPSALQQQHTTTNSNRGSKMYVFHRQSSGVDTVSSASSTRFSGSSWMETCIDDDFDDINDNNNDDDNNNGTDTDPDPTPTPHDHTTSSLSSSTSSAPPLRSSSKKTHVCLDDNNDINPSSVPDIVGCAIIISSSSDENDIGGDKNNMNVDDNDNHCSNNIIIRSPTPTENTDIFDDININTTSHKVVGVRLPNQGGDTEVDNDNDDDDDLFSSQQGQGHGRLPFSSYSTRSSSTTCAGNRQNAQTMSELSESHRDDNNYAGRSVVDYIDIVVVGDDGDDCDNGKKDGGSGSSRSRDLGGNGFPKNNVQHAVSSKKGEVEMVDDESVNTQQTYQAKTQIPQCEECGGCKGKPAVLMDENARKKVEVKGGSSNLERSEDKLLDTQTLNGSGGRDGSVLPLLCLDSKYRTNSISRSSSSGGGGGALSKEETAGCANVAMVTTRNYDGSLCAGERLESGAVVGDGSGCCGCGCEGGGGGGNKVQRKANGVGSNPNSRRITVDSIEGCRVNRNGGRDGTLGENGCGGAGGGGGDCGHSSDNVACENSSSINSRGTTSRTVLENSSSCHCHSLSSSSSSHRITHAQNQTQYQNQTCESSLTLLSSSSSSYKDVVVPSISLSSSSSTTSLRVEQSDAPGNLELESRGAEDEGSDTSESSIDVGMSSDNDQQLEIML